MIFFSRNWLSFTDGGLLRCCRMSNMSNVGKATDGLLDKLSTLMRGRDGALSYLEEVRISGLEFDVAEIEKRLHYGG